MKETFGQYLKHLRQDKAGVSQEELASRIGRVKMTVSQYERDAGAPPQGEVLHLLIAALDLDDEEASRLTFLSSSGRNSIPDDVADYFFNNPVVYEAIRAAKSNRVGKAQWDYFIASIEGDNG